MSLMPNKNSNPDLTILAVSTFILKKLHKSRIENYIDLFTQLEKHDERAVSLFNSALRLLFILGVINYYPKNDLIELVKK